VTRLPAFLVALAVVLAACQSTPSVKLPPSCGLAFGSPVVGIVTSVDSGSLGDVRGFELRTIDGIGLELEIGDLENPVEFPPAHLAEHKATSSPVRAFFRCEGDRLVAYRLEDGD
jgi:hypothetical protein